MRDLLGKRVEVEGRVGVLQGLPPAGGVWIYDEAARTQVWVDSLDVSDARFTCDNCGQACNSVYDHPAREGLWCASCAVPYAQTHQAKPTCERCGAIGAAVRNPKRGRDIDHRHLCRKCHVEVGSDFALPASAMRTSEPLEGGQGRPECAAAGNVASTPCMGSVKPRQPTGEQLCNAHAGKRRTGERSWA